MIGDFGPYSSPPPLAALAVGDTTGRVSLSPQPVMKVIAAPPIAAMKADLEICLSCQLTSKYSRDFHLKVQGLVLSCSALLELSKDRGSNRK